MYVHTQSTTTTTTTMLGGRFGRKTSYRNRVVEVTARPFWWQKKTGVNYVNARTYDRSTRLYTHAEPPLSQLSTQMYSLKQKETHYNDKYVYISATNARAAAAALRGLIIWDISIRTHTHTRAPNQPPHVHAYMYVHTTCV